MDSFFPNKLAKRLSKIKIYKDIHTNTYNDRNSKPQQKHRLRTVSKNLPGVGVKGLYRFYMATTLALSSAEEG